LKALILAAGQGTRIRSAHARPKCLIPCNQNGWMILDQQIDSLFSAGVSEIGIAVGYEKDQIVKHVSKYHRQRLARFRFIENPAFAETNNIYSLWLARDWLAGAPFICLNADVLCDSRILAPAIESDAPVTMIVDPAWRDETMKVVIERKRVIRMSKQITRDEFSGTYIGITAFSAATHASLFSKIRDLIESGNRHVFFNVAVQQLADEGLPVAYTETEGLPWAEIDDPADLAFAQQHVFPVLFASIHAA
jgi:choline kinase